MRNDTNDQKSFPGADSFGGYYWNIDNYNYDTLRCDTDTGVGIHFRDEVEVTDELEKLWDDFLYVVDENCSKETGLKYGIKGVFPSYDGSGLSYWVRDGRFGLACTIILPDYVEITDEYYISDLVERFFNELSDIIDKYVFGTKLGIIVESVD